MNGLFAEEIYAS